MDEPRERQVEDDDAFIVVWRRIFTKEQLREARKRLPFDVTARAMENGLARVELKMGGFLQHDASKGLTQTRFTLQTQSGDKGMDFTIAEDVSGMFGWGYYQQPTTQRRDAWIRVGSMIIGLINHGLDTCAAEALIAQYGQDAFEENTDFDSIDFIFDGQPIGKHLLNFVAYNDKEYGQRVQDLVNAYSVTTVTTAATVDLNPIGVAPPPLAQPAENPDRRDRKEEVYRLLMEGLSLKETSERSKNLIPYSTVRMFRDELIAENRLSKAIKKKRKNPRQDSI